MTLKDCSFKDAGDYVEGMSVAVVGNSPVLLNQGFGPQIDNHDIVIRMNTAVPPKNGDLGVRSSILGCGVIEPLDRTINAKDPDWLWWFKLTETGARHLAEARYWYEDNRRSANLYEWPRSLQFRLGEEAGVSPSSGLRILWLLTRSGWRPKDVTTYGMTFWGMDSGHPGETSWYSGKKAHRSHDPKKEYAYFLKMGFERLGDGHWRKA